MFYRRDAETQIFHIQLFISLRLSDFAVKSSFRSGLFLIYYALSILIFLLLIPFGQVFIKNIVQILTDFHPIFLRGHFVQTAHPVCIEFI
jgi:hypothetical protein